jgi:hypothetical protein
VGSPAARHAPVICGNLGWWWVVFASSVLGSQIFRSPEEGGRRKREEQGEGSALVFFYIAIYIFSRFKMSIYPSSIRSFKCFATARGTNVWDQQEESGKSISK